MASIWRTSVSDESDCFEHRSASIFHTKLLILPTESGQIQIFHAKTIRFFLALSNADNAIIQKWVQAGPA